MRPVALLTLLLAGGALADAQKPKLAVHPLVLQGVDSKKDRDELTALLPGIIIGVGKVEIASPSDVDTELKKKGQAFCAPENLFKCLSYIADHTSSVYAIRIELRRGGRPGEWELIGNVVCVDGQVMRQPEIFTFSQPESVKFLPIARAKLEEFVASLKLATMPLAPPARPVAVEPAPVKADPPKLTTRPVDSPVVAAPPPIVPAKQSMSSGRVAAATFGGVAAVALAASGITALVARSTAIGLTSDLRSGAVPFEKRSVAHEIDQEVLSAQILVGVGLGAAAVSAILFLVSDKTSAPVVAPTAVPGGAGVVFSSPF